MKTQYAGDVPLVATEEASVTPVPDASEGVVPRTATTSAVAPLDAVSERSKMPRPVNVAQNVEQHPVGTVGWISLAALSLMLGRTNARAARDWCNRHEVPYRRDGKHGFARVTDVQRALEALPLRGECANDARVNVAASRAAASIMSRGRR